MTNSLLNFAEARGHRVIYANLPESGSLSVEGDICLIGIDPGLTLAEQKVRLAHELGHCERGGFYHHYSPCETRGRIEHRAKVWSYEAIVPPDAIHEAINAGASNLWELTESLGVTIEFMNEAMEYYRNTRGIEF